MTRFARRLQLAALAILLTGPAAAQTGAARLAAVPGDVRRFVLDAVPPNGWMVSQDVDMIELRFPGYLAEIALPPAVRAPLQDLSTASEDGDTVVRFVISCDCSLAVAVRGGKGLSIDLIERAMAERPAAPAHAPVPPLRTRTAADAAASDGSAEVDVVEARKRMMEQLMRAAEAGLIELDKTHAPPSDTRPEAPDDGPETAEGHETEEGAPKAPDPATDGDTATKAPAEETPAKPAPEPATDGDTATKAPAEEAPAKPAPDPRRRTADRADDGEKSPDREKSPPGTEPAKADGDRDEGGDPGLAAKEPAICHGAATFNLPRPGSAGEWTGGVGLLRAGLIGEFDRPNEETVLDLGRMYLSAGLAEEALAVLNEFGAGNAKAAVLAEVATVIAGKDLPGDASVLRADCLGPQALWRALAVAQAGDPAGAMAAEQSAGRALEGLPRPLRREIAARLGLAAADAGQWDTARRLHALAERSDPEGAGAAGRRHFLAARIARWNGDEVATIRSLTLARKADPAVAAEATLMLAETVLRSGRLERDGLPRLITDLGLIARLHRGTATGARAAGLEVRLSDLVTGRARAIDLLTLGLALGNFTEETFTATLSAMAEGDDTKARDSIAAIYLDDPAAFGPALADPDFRAVLARSLIKLGLPAQAAGLYARDRLPVDIAASLAWGYLETGDHRSAIALIADLPQSPERDRLHRAAMTGAGTAIAPPEGGEGAGTPSPEDLAALARMAIAAGDLRRALDLTLQRLKHDGGDSAAETAAIIAMALGRSDIPDAAADHLRQTDPDLHARMLDLFSTPPARLDPAVPASAAAYLKRLDAEIAVIEDALDDG